MLKRLGFNLWYLGKPPWDTGITPPELRRVIEDDGHLSPGKALDIGCGTGTNSLYLAERGWSVIGVDFARLAIMLARHKARRAKKKPHFLLCDVVHLPSCPLVRKTAPFDLAVDIGCSHALSPEDYAAYLQSLSGLLAPQGILLLYALLKTDPAEKRPGIERTLTESLFQSYFTILDVAIGIDPGGRASAWYRLQKTE